MTKPSSSLPWDMKTTTTMGKHMSVNLSAEEGSHEDPIKLSSSSSDVEKKRCRCPRWPKHWQCGGSIQLQQGGWWQGWQVKDNGNDRKQTAIKTNDSNNYYSPKILGNLLVVSHANSRSTANDINTPSGQASRRCPFLSACIMTHQRQVGNNM